MVNIGHSRIARNMPTFSLAVECGKLRVAFVLIFDCWIQPGVDDEIRVDERKVRMNNFWCRPSGRTGHLRLLGADACDGEYVELSLWWRSITLIWKAEAVFREGDGRRADL